MKLNKPNSIPIIAACLATALSTQAAERFVWSDGHGDLAVNYRDGAWQWNAEEGKEVDRVIIRLNDSTRNQVPANPDFSFLGTAGDPIWIIPAGQTIGIPFLGINAQATPSGTFVNDRFDLLLSSVSGPGDFIMWTTSGTGAPTILMNSRDGISAADKTDIPAGGHFHQNWGFTSPGTYRVGFKASGNLNGQTTPITSDEEIYTFEVNVLKDGEADIEVAYEGGELEFHIHDEVADVEFDPGHVALQARPAAWQPVPHGAAFAFFGKPGASLYVLPQDETEGVLFLGLAAAEVEQGVFANNRISIDLVSVTGPGSVFYHEVDGFGAPTVFFNSANGIDAADVVTVNAGAHAHRNWSFTAPGVYRVTLQAKGTLAGGGDISSQPATFLFEVLPPAFIDRGEVDLEIAFEEGAFELGLHEDATGVERSPDETVLIVRPASQSTVPADSQFSFLGAPASKIYVLSQDETEGLLFLGLAADEIAAGVFVGESVKLQLSSIQGPGQLALYTIDSFSKPTAFWNSANGLDGSDAFPAVVGSHTHANWAFTAPGVYRIGLKASGTLVAGSQAVTSEVVTFTFQVQAPVVINQGEIDFEIAYENGELEMGLLDEAADREFETSDVILVAQPAARQTVPNNPAFSFLGTAGTSVHILPQDEAEGLLFVGIAGDEIETGLFTSETVRLELVSAAGPGEFSLYAVDSFSSPTVFMNTRDGISSADMFPTAVGSHTHVNWAFSQAGEYRLAFRARGTLVAGNQTVESEPVTLTFLVEDSYPALVLAAQLINNGKQFQIGWPSRNGVSYQLQSRTALGSGDWSNEGAPITATGGQQTAMVDKGNETLKVFRILEVRP